LGELGEVVMREHWRVTHKLVDNVGLGSVEGRIVVANVLGAMENFECQAVEELALGEQSTYRLKTPTGT
jgi:hypothetical protein